MREREQQESSTTVAPGRCGVHWFDRAVSRCVDCRAELCEHCVIEVASLGAFCSHCALIRGGVRSRRRATSTNW